MKTLALYSIKGGVGKTSSCMNLAYLAAAGGARVLVWDLDPQGAASFYARVEARVRGGAKRLLSRRHALLSRVKGTDFKNLDLLPADFSYRHMDLQLGGFKRRNARLGKLIKPLAEDYDYVFLDCPPSISLVSENVFSAADALLVPLIPTTLSVRTLDQLNRFLDEGDAPKLQVLPFFSMADRRKRLHRELMEELAKSRRKVLETVIPLSAEVERMGVRRAPVCAFAPTGVAGQCYARLWNEISEVLESTPSKPKKRSLLRLQGKSKKQKKDKKGKSRK